jgi:cell division protein FtsA
MAKKKWIAAGIDVGTTKICSCVAELEEDRIQVLGTGWASSKGLKKGVVVNLSETIKSLRHSLEKAEEAANEAIESAFVSVGGRFIRSTNTSAQTEVRGRNGRVSTDDIGRAVSEAKNFELPEEYQIIHVLTQGFRLDGQDGVSDPLGMSGHRLSVRLHLVLNATAVVQNIVNAINKAGVVVNGVVMQQLASAEAVLTEDEKELGTALVDIGGGTTDISIYSHGSIWHSEVLPMGGSLITKDIAIGLRAPLQEAEQLKISAGGVFPDSVPAEEMVEIGEMGSGKMQSYPRRLLCQIAEARCEEILHATGQVFRRAGVRPDLTSGVVLTGGGSLMHGLVEKAQEILEMPARIGYPVNFESKNPEIRHPAYSTALGLLKYAQGVRSNETARIARSAVRARPKATTERLKNWIFERI